MVLAVGLSPRPLIAEKRGTMITFGRSFQGNASSLLIKRFEEYERVSRRLAGIEYEISRRGLPLPKRGDHHAAE